MKSETTYMLFIHINAVLEPLQVIPTGELSLNDYDMCYDNAGLLYGLQGCTNWHRQQYVAARYYLFMSEVNILIGLQIYV